MKAIPYQKCPVCEGYGQKLPNPFAATVTVSCNTCGGKGIIPMAEATEVEETSKDLELDEVLDEILPESFPKGLIKEPTAEAMFKGSRPMTEIESKVADEVLLENSKSEQDLRLEALNEWMELYNEVFSQGKYWQFFELEYDEVFDNEYHMRLKTLLKQFGSEKWELIRTSK